MGLILTVVGVLIANIVCYGLGQDCFHFPHAFLNLLNRQISIAENDLISVISFAYGVNLHRVDANSCILQILQGFFSELLPRKLCDEVQSRSITVNMYLIGEEGRQCIDNGRSAFAVDFSCAHNMPFQVARFDKTSKEQFVRFTDGELLKVAS